MINYYLIIYLAKFISKNYKIKLLYNLLNYLDNEFLYYLKNKYSNLEIINITNGINYNDYNCKKLKRSNRYIYLFGGKIINKCIKNIINVEKIFMSNEIRVINGESFMGYKNMNEIIFSKNLEHIGIQSFQCCENLKQIIFPENLKQIDGHSFFGCHNLENIIFNNKLVYIGAFAFTYCKKLNNINLPKNIFIINEGTFMGCNFSELTIPDNIKIIKDDSFYKCNNLKQLYISKNIYYIGNSILSNNNIKIIYY